MLCQRAGAMDTPADAPTADELFPTFAPELAAFLIGPDDHPGMALDEGLPAYLGMRIVDVTPGVVVIEVPVRAELVHRFGALHGGVVSTLVDQALGSAVFPLIPAGTWPATLEFKVNYMAAARAGVLRATGRVASLRTRTAVVTVEVDNVVDGDRRLVAVAQGTISLNPPRHGEQGDPRPPG